MKIKLCILFIGAGLLSGQAPVKRELSIANTASVGTTLNTLTKLTGAPSTAVIAGTSDTGGVVGITIAGAGTTGSSTVSTSGTTFCVFDGATTAGDYIQISATVAGNCRDSGSIYPTSGQVIGRALSTHGSGGTYTMNLFSSELQASSGGGGSMTWPGSPGIAIYSGSGAWGTSLTAPSGTTVGTTDQQTLTNKTLTNPSLGAGSGMTISIPNAGATGTTQYKTAKLTGAPSTAVIGSTSDTNGIVGIVVGGAGTTGSAEVARAGEATCTFDGTTTAGHYVQLSSSVGGDCTDAGAAYPTSGQVLGFVLSTIGSAGNATVLLRPDIQATTGGGGGSITVNGSGSGTNLSNTTPAAGTGYTNVTFQISGANMSAEIQRQLTATFLLCAGGCYAGETTNWKWSAPFALTFTGCVIDAATYPTGAAVTVDLLKGGATTIFSSTVPTLAGGSSAYSTDTGMAANAAFTQGQYLIASVLTAGSTVAGQFVNVVCTATY